jgi:hypothetical protein
VVGLEQQRRIPRSLRQIQEAIGELARRAERPTTEIKEPQPPQRRKQVWCRLDASAQIAGERVAFCDLGSAKPAGGHQFAPKGDPKDHLACVSLASCRQALEER